MSDAVMGVIADIVHIEMGQSPAGSSTNRSGIGDPLLNGPSEFGDAHPTPQQWTVQGVRFAEPGDTLFCVRGSTTGRMNVANQRFAIGRGLAAIRGKKSDADTRFAKYAIENVLPDLLAGVTGSVFPNLSRSQIGLQKVSLPSESNRKAIAEVLGALDDKIAANTRLAATAIELVMSRFARLLRQSRSETVPVESLVRRLVQPRKFAAPDFFARGDFPVYDQSAAGFLGYAQGSGSLEASAKNPILYFGDHTCILRLSIERFAVGPNTVPFVGSEIPSIVLFCALQGAQKHEEYKRHWQDLMTRYVEVPVRDAADDFAVQNTPTFELRDALSAENRTLAATRDALLPQLMSGKLRVRDAETAVEAVV